MRKLIYTRVSVSNESVDCVVWKLEFRRDVDIVVVSVLSMTHFQLPLCKVGLLVCLQ